MSSDTGSVSLTSSDTQASRFGHHLGRDRRQAVETRRDPG